MYCVIYKFCKFVYDIINLCNLFSPHKLWVSVCVIIVELDLTDSNRLVNLNLSVRIGLSR